MNVAAPFTVLRGQLTLTGSKTRPPEDGLWLMSLLPAGAAGTVLDAGCGSGLVGLAVARQWPRCAVTLIDTNSQKIAEAIINNNRNGSRVQVTQQDVFTVPPHSYDIVLTNPPFFTREAGHHKQDGYLNQAYVQSHGDIAAWCQHCIAVARSAAGLVLHRDQLPLIEALAQIHQVTLIALKTTAQKPAKRLLVWLDKTADSGIARYLLRGYDPAVRAQVLEQGEPCWPLLERESGG